MSDPFKIKRNDTSPAYRVTLTGGDGNAVSVAGGSVRFHMFTRAGVSVVDADATIIDAPNGIVQYDWQAADTANAGIFNCEFEVTYADTTVETFPNYKYRKIQITEDLA